MRVGADGPEHADLPVGHPADPRSSAVLLGWLPTSGAGSVVGADHARDRAWRALDGDLRAHDAHRRGGRAVEGLCARRPRARPVAGNAVVVRHVLRNAAIPVVTIAALEIGNLLAGAVIVETVFAWPGIGQLAIQSIQSRDFLVVQGDRPASSPSSMSPSTCCRHRLCPARPPHPAAQRMMSAVAEATGPRGRCRSRWYSSARSLR